MAEQRRSRWLDLALSALFLGLLWLPLASRVVPLAPRIPLRENRALAAAPPLRPGLDGLRRFPRGFDRYYEDHFGLRPLFVLGFNLLRSRIPGLDVSKKVLVGKAGWYYVTARRTVEDYRGLIRLDAGRLAAIRETLEARRDLAASLGARYLVVFAPAKWEIYPEFLPGRIGRVSEDSILSQVIRYLASRSDIDFVDLRPALRAAKGSYRVYGPLDSHWSDMGAFVASQVILRRLCEWFPEGVVPETLADYEVQPVTLNGDLAALMGLNHLLKRHTVRLVPRDPGGVFPVEGDRAVFSRFEAFEGAGAPGGGVRAVIYHDSFGCTLKRFLSRGFTRSVFVWRSEPEIDRLERERPRVVIQEMGQRSLWLFPDRE